MTEQVNVQKSKGKSATQRNKNKAKKTTVPKSAEKFTPVFLYISDCHSAVGSKKPLVRESSVKPSDPTSYSEGHLGVFRCSVCKKKAKFSRKLNKEQETLSV